MGRPKLSDEEKARRAEERKQRKLALYQTKKVYGVSDKALAAEIVKAKKDVPQIKSEDELEIERIEKIMAHADEIRRQQTQIPKETAVPQGNSELIFISRAKEPTIEDEPRDPRPDFVQKDESGWSEIPI